MKKNKILILVGILIIIVCVAGLSINFYNNYRIKNAVKVVRLGADKLEIYSDVKLSNIIEDINGELLDDFNIDTTELGRKRIDFWYINDDKIKVPYSFYIDIVDTTPPIISMSNSFSITVNDDVDVASSLFCGDNYDDNPKCYIEGTYDKNTVGDYPVTFVGVDSSNNRTSHDMTIKVRKKSSGGTSQSNDNVTLFSDILRDYKTKDNKIGIDVSHWQGDIDFDKVKKAGVEFAYIRVGRRNGINGEFVLDKKFIQNIEGFNKAKIPVGVYFYSYADSIKDAREEARWILKQIKDYKVDLEVVFDWEDWDNFQEHNLSFYKLTKMAKEFNKTVTSNGYTGMLYSSKNYLENMWYPVDFPVWLAHYTKSTNYSGDYRVWQICNDGKVDGIFDNYVDIDIMVG